MVITLENITKSKLVCNHVTKALTQTSYQIAAAQFQLQVVYPYQC